MTLNITIPENINDTKPKICVIGIGGAGGNAVNTMISEKIENIDFLVANTDGQALSRSLTSKQIQLGKTITLGLGAGSDAETGKKAAEESIEEIIAELSDVNMLFITTGMGGGTGSGASPVIAKAAREKGILTVAVVTKPFDFEGKKRMDVAEKSLSLLKENVDTLIVIPNQNLFKIANEKTTFAEAFKMADDVLYQGICGITNLITNPGMINLDFADITTVMVNMGSAMMGTGEGSGENRAKNAAQAALNNPLLDDTNIKGARSILLNIQGGPDMALFEVDEAASKIRNEVDENANIIFGSSIDNNLEGIIKVSVVATGINRNENQNYFENKIEKDQLISKNENLGLETEDSEDKTTTISTGENVEIIEESGIDQIDLVSEINRLDIKKENMYVSDEDVTNLNINNEKLKSIFDNKPDNQFTQSKPQSLFNRVSSFFGKDKISEIKLDPNLNKQKDVIEEKKFENSNMDTNLDQVDQSLQNMHANEINFDLNKNDEVSENNRNNFDLFNNVSQSTIDKHQIDLTEIEREDEDIDEKVLEIPAFLRRQAN
ncbi:MAG: cell division protein FtsZ [Rhodospirillaceae bacterium]|nr:cell division protein FtsZ [Rhodospirillaceae bacterium]|tara:strand:+ start:162 stop:1811 length:1650 start_codon:yes stop_codon:yes gene_type:complete